MGIYYKHEASLFKNSLSELQFGDVLLCLGKSSGKKDIAGEVAKSITGSKYAHAAIFIGNNEIVEVMIKDGVKKVELYEFLYRYLHCAVLRRKEAWTPSRQERFLTYINKLIRAETEYNYSKALKLADQYITDEKTLSVIKKVLKSSESQTSINDESFLCSELVALSFIITGFIGKSAEFLFDPKTKSPIDLSEDRAYGDILGYIWTDKKYQVPQSDELFHCMY